MEQTQAWLVVRKVRLATGLVLFAYVLSHLLNHALGLVSLATAETGRVWFLAIWRSWLGTVLLYGSLLVHLLLALWSIYRRRTLKMPTWEAAQLVLGLAIPPLLVQHVIGTRALHEIAGIEDSYAYIGLVLWHWLPEKGLQQVVTLAVAWLHGCIGVHFWLRLRPWYREWLPFFYGAALLVPVLATLGFVDLGREVAVLARDEAWLAAAKARIGQPEATVLAGANAALNAAYWTMAGLLAATLALRAARLWLDRRRGLVRLTYASGRSVELYPGTTVLEASRMAGVPHASVCGGRGRCSTCRVRIDRGLDGQAPASEAERKVLDRVAAPPNVRLACQLRPTADLSVTPLLPPDASPAAARARPSHLKGEEKEIAILFADLRGFTRMAEGKLPYDVVFVLNRYFESMGRAVEESGGTLDKFIGDGVMALFGIERGTEAGCREALAAARAMGERLSELNRALGHDLEHPLRIGIGIHAGPAIVGEMGYARATTVTAVGDAVNTASRLESLTKELDAELVISQRVAEAAGLRHAAIERREVDIRGRREPLTVFVMRRAAEIELPPAPGRRV